MVVLVVVCTMAVELKARLVPVVLFSTGLMMRSAKASVCIKSDCHLDQVRAMRLTGIVVGNKDFQTKSYSIVIIEYFSISFHKRGLGRNWGLFWENRLHKHGNVSAGLVVRDFW